MRAEDVEAVMAGLKGFQRDAVEHVVDRFYGPDGSHRSRRFLVADETGLGKSIVARGVIARAIQHLQTVDDVERIDIVYVCSNADLASQNLRRLNVTGDPAIGMASRLTLLARHSHQLSEPPTGGGKRVNLVSFTPGTSFNQSSWRFGSADERALLTLLLDQIAGDTEENRTANRFLLRGTTRKQSRFDGLVRQLGQDLSAGPDPAVRDEFQRVITENGQLRAYADLRETTRPWTERDDATWAAAGDLVARLRRSLAKAGLNSLEPDLVILDEFQRFRHLLEAPEQSEAAELAHALYSFKDARTLLLSATPYKPYTAAHETEDDHYSDFLKTIAFLAEHDSAKVATVQDSLRAHRRTLVAGGDSTRSANAVRDALLSYMCRSERPPLSTTEDMVTTRELAVNEPTTADLTDWVALTRLGEHLGTPIRLEYWKSIPYFATFMESYKSGSAARRALKEDPSTAPLLAATRGAPAEDMARFGEIDLGNGLLRSLVKDTVDAGWWRLLWMPPSMPYLEPGPTYAAVGHDVTKRVIFSSWSGVPTALASLLSYEADRQVAAHSLHRDSASGGLTRLLNKNTPEGRRRVPPRLRWTVEGNEPRGMAALALFWPHPGLADIGDPLEAARRAGHRLTSEELATEVSARLSAGEPTDQPWAAFFSAPGAVPAGLDVMSATTAVEDDAAHEAEAPGDVDTTVDHPPSPPEGLLGLHVRRALETANQPTRTHPDTGSFAAHAPGVIAYRAVRSIAGACVGESAVWEAAWRLAMGLRSLFNRPETTALLVGLAHEHGPEWYGRTHVPAGGEGEADDVPYWRIVLTYCADGNLQAVVDEYLHHLRGDRGGGDIDDDALLQIADDAARALTLRAVTYTGHDTTPQRRDIRFSSHFAVRYGGAHQSDTDEKGGDRQRDVRAAFNSPFRPFVLASTSVGQEGIDFHWWSHAVVHWNLPSNPVDFEQREGRVHRFAGHAVRKNIARQHWDDVLSKSGPAWVTAFAAAEFDTSELGEFAPWWIYPGESRVQRILATYPLSRDRERYEALRDALTLYRLTLGQPRQEDLLRLIGQTRAGGHAAAIDLRPPPRVVRDGDGGTA